MSGISTGIGLISGIDTGHIIQQLLAIEARPRTQAQQRLVALQGQQAAILDINSRLNALRDAAQTFRINRIFRSASATSSDETVLTATAGVTAAPGSYSLLVDRLVTTQQTLSRGFASRTSGGVGLTEMSFESDHARLDRDTSLGELNGGAGISRGRITIIDSGGRTATVDLSRVATVGEVLEAINGNGTAQVTASVSEGRLVIRDNAAGSLTVANATGYTTATSLGIAGAATGTLTGQTVYSLGSETALSTLNDGNGIAVRNVIGVSNSQFSITLDDGISPAVTVSINVGDVYENQDPEGDGSFTTPVKVEDAVNTIGGVLTRINEALADEGVTGVTASASGQRLAINDTQGRTITVAEVSVGSTARDLGLLGTGTGGVLTGDRVQASINSTLARSISGGAGLSGDGVLNITARDGFAFTVNLDPDSSISDIISAIQTAGGTTAGGQNRVSVSVNANGTGLQLVDNTAGASNLIVSGSLGNDTAAALGLTVNAATSSVSGANLQHQYISRATRVADLNGGRGIGTGVFRITDANGHSATVDIGADTLTLGQLIDEINSRGIDVTARVNSSGDGLEIVETTPGTGASRIRIEDTSGIVAESLRIEGEATDVGVENLLNGSYERTLTFDPTDTLEEVVTAINEAGVGVNASVIRDASPTTPYRLSLTADSSGAAGRFLVNAGSLDLGLATIQRGQDSRVFYGATDSAAALMLGGSSNTLDDAITGVQIDLHSASDDPVTLTIARDTAAIEEKINAFVEAFNEVIGRIDLHTNYDQESRRKGALLGDGSVLALRSSVYSTIQGRALNAGGRFSRLADVGLTVGDGGNIELDAERLREALAEDPAGVESLFAARVQTNTTEVELAEGVTATDPNAPDTFSSLGVMGQIEQLVKRYTNSIDGALTTKNRSLDDIIRLQTRRIEDFTAKLEFKRLKLQRQFASMEIALQQLQSQQSALQSLG